jgi:glutamate-ammonia-ligase adenylyltransferase
VNVEEANAELSDLAEACVQYAVEVVTRRHRLRAAPFAVIGLGKFGGRELIYGSDLDIIFVAPDRTRDLARLQKLAAEVLDLLSARTAHGTVFALDARLRPDGDKGLLVNLLRAHEEYYRHRAMLWEIQALTRARAVGGHVETGRAFEDLAKTLTNFKNPSLPLAALTPNWKAEIAAMRLRIQKERTPRGKDHLAFKTGIGGLIDAEFLAQAVSMEHGWFEPNTLKSLERARAGKVLSEADAEKLIPAFRHLREMESILRRWSFEGEAVLPEDPEALYRVAARCGYRAAEPFLAAVSAWRAQVREVYASFFPETS